MAHEQAAQDEIQPPRLAIALVSAAALAYEVLQTRLFSISQWHHFAYMIISLALLGYGVSGTFIALARERLLSHFRGAFVTQVVGLGISMPACYILAQRIPFHAEQVLWDPQQPLFLLGVYLLLAIPFFFAANAIGLALSRFGRRAAGIYAADLLGAGLGSLGIIGLLFLVFPGRSVAIVAGLGLAAAAVAWRELRLRPGGAALLLLALALLMAIATPGRWLQPEISQYKGLSQTLEIPGTEVLAKRSSPLGLLHVVASPEVPLRQAPGLSLRASSEIPEQVAVFTDGSGLSPIARYDGQREALAYMDQTTSALPYHLASIQRVAVLGAGGGSGVLQALYHQVPEIDAVEVNPQMASLVTDRFAEFSGNLYERPGVSLHIAEARGFLTTTPRRYDLVQLAMVQAAGASAAGLHALNESYIYTVEALQTYLQRLRPGGYLAITRWAKLPPRDTLKLIATARQALEREGVQSPGEHLVLIRNWQTATLLIKRGPVSGDEVEALRHFAQDRAFDVAYHPGITRESVNRFNVLREPYFYEGTKALLGPRAPSFREDYKFNLRPATDNRPYFFHFMKWSALPELLDLRGQGGMPLIEWGYLVLIATLLQALVLSLVLILVPLLVNRRMRALASRSHLRGRTLAYFGALGFAFLFVEMAFIQRFILFLHHPVYATGVVLTAFLVFASLGSAVSGSLGRRMGLRRAMVLATVGIAVVGALYALGLTPALQPMLGWPDLARIGISLLLIAPLAFVMGMPFPLGLTALGDYAPGLIPWAWGINGCTSVISAVLGTLLALHLGFTLVVVFALVLYAVAAAAFPQARSQAAVVQ